MQNPPTIANRITIPQASLEPLGHAQNAAAPIASTRAKMPLSNLVRFPAALMLHFKGIDFETAQFRVAAQRSERHRLIQSSTFIAQIANRR
jgi:hypothetical protein